MKRNLRRISVMALGLGFVLVSLYAARSEYRVIGTTSMQKDTDAHTRYSIA